MSYLKGSDREMGSHINYERIQECYYWGKGNLLKSHQVHRWYRRATSSQDQSSHMAIRIIYVFKHVGRTSFLDRKIKRKRKFKQWWSTISIKRLITSLLYSTYHSKNDPGSYTSFQLFRLFHYSPDSGRWSILNTRCKKSQIIKY